MTKKQLQRQNRGSKQDADIISGKIRWDKEQHSLLMLALNNAPPVEPGGASQSDRLKQDLLKAVAATAQSLEAGYYGQYVVINASSGEFVAAPTVSEAHSKFDKAFGPTAPGYCLRVGVSPFVAA